MILDRGISWAMPNGQWRKENLSIELDTAVAPEGLTHSQKVAYVSIELEVDLLNLKWFYGGMDKETLDASIANLRTTQQNIASFLS